MMANHTRWIVTTSGDRSLSEIKKEVSSAGFAVDQVLDEIGCITGSGNNDIVKKLEKIPGITDVSPETPIDIGPPNAPVTW